VFVLICTVFVLICTVVVLNCCVCVCVRARVCARVRVRVRVCVCVCVLSISSDTLTEVFPCFSLSCKANARVIINKDWARPTRFQIYLFFFVIRDVLLLIVMLYVLHVNVYCHRVSTHLQLTNISIKFSYLMVSAYRSYFQNTRLLSALMLNL
jgi:hypothetical protein